jgi:hypothetical protein
MEDKVNIENKSENEENEPQKPMSYLAELGLIVFLGTLFGIGFSNLLGPFFNNMFSSVGGMGLK